MKTAVEWYAEADIELTILFLEGRMSKLEYGMKKMMLINEAKEKMRDQIEEAYRIGTTTELTFGENKAEQYYKQRYGKEAKQ